MNRWIYSTNVCRLPITNTYRFTLSNNTSCEIDYDRSLLYWYNGTVINFDNNDRLNAFFYKTYIIDFSKVDMAPSFDKVLNKLDFVKCGGYYAIKQLAEYYSFYHFENEDSYKYALVLLNYYGQEKRV